ncbi:hypothetical protein ACFL6H_08280 [Candidatus Latescibacterota bacterium]
MIIAQSLSKAELLKQINWLEREIDTCLEFDLPTKHLENQLNAIDQILFYKEKAKNDASVFMHI